MDENEVIASVPEHSSPADVIGEGELESFRGAILQMLAYWDRPLTLEELQAGVRGFRLGPSRLGSVERDVESLLAEELVERTEDGQRVTLTRKSTGLIKRRGKRRVS